MRQGVDISNWTALDQYLADFLRGYFDFVTLGLQDGTKARDFKAMIVGDGSTPTDFEYYEDKPGRLEQAAKAGLVWSPGEWTWIDIEPGCFENAPDVRSQGTANTEAGLVTQIYCNETSIVRLFGDSHELADYGCELVYASYVPPLPKNWRPFNGWISWRTWQCSSLGVRINRGEGAADINCDLLVQKESA